MKALGELGALGGLLRRGAWGTRGLHGEAGKPGVGHWDTVGTLWGQGRREGGGRGCGSCRALILFPKQG